jgi:hypothetical protein
MVERASSLSASWHCGVMVQESTPRLRVTVAAERDGAPGFVLRCLTVLDGTRPTRICCGFLVVTRPRGNDSAVPWAQRGVEWAAETIADRTPQHCE